MTGFPLEFTPYINGRSPMSYLVPVVETAFVIPAEAGIQVFRYGPLLSQG